VHYAALDSHSPAEAIKYLRANFKGIDAYLMGAKARGIGFAVFAGKKNLTRDELDQPVGRDAIRIAPILIGNKRGGLLNIILGVVLVVVGVYLRDPQLIAEGAVMIVGGVIQMLSPLPKGLNSKDSPGNTPSYAFNGPINTEA
jgi:predicted phage tail protein